MTATKKIIEYISRSCYYLDKGDVTDMKEIMDARTLACYITDYYKKITKEDTISPLKLQKSLYFCFAYWGGFIRRSNSFGDGKTEIPLNYSEVLFNNTIEAWVYGPVVPDVYHEESLDNYREENPFDGEKYIQEFINNILDDVLNTNNFKLV